MDMKPAPEAKAEKANEDPFEKFDDDELADELEARGFKVYCDDEDPECEWCDKNREQLVDRAKHAIDMLQRGYLKDARHEMERLLEDLERNVGCW